MRHVIIGGSGFTGQAIAQKLLSRGEQLVIFDQTRPDQGAAGFVEGDATRAEDLDRLGLGPDDAVYHLAARQFAGPVPRHDRDAWFDAVNVLGTRMVLDAMRRGGARRLIFFSTDMTYGIPERIPVTPDHPQHPLGPYGASKLRAEMLIRAAMEGDGLAATIFRPRLITGPGRLGILAKLFRLIRAGLPVPMIGSGRNRYQMVSVADCADAALRAVELGCPPGPFNLGSATPPTTRELLQAIIREARSTSFVVPLPAAPLKAVLAALDKSGRPLLFPEQFGIADKDILLDTAATRSVLGWAPAEDDITAMVKAYRAFAGG
jgi:dTDP-glucose 4,6-dehydratase